MLITRYLGKNLLVATGFVLLALTTVIWLTQSMKVLELIANSDAPISLFLRLILLTLPKFLEIILPASLVIAVLFVYSRMITDNELIVMRACGVDHRGLARPALMLAGAAALVLLILGTYLSPKSTTQMILLRQEVKTKYSAFLLREGVFNTFGNKLTVYLRARGTKGDLYGLMIHDMREKDKPPVTVTAKRGHIVTEDGVPTIVVFDGMRQQIDPRSGTLTKLYFSQYTIEIKGLESEKSSRWRNTSERTIIELFNPDMNNPRDRTSGKVFAAEINNRLVTPLNAVGFTLIALCSVLLGGFNRRGQGRKIALAAGIVVLAQSLNMTLVSLMKGNIAFAPLFYATTILPVIGGLWLLHPSSERLLRQWRGRGGEESA